MFVDFWVITLNQRVNLLINGILLEQGKGRGLLFELSLLSLIYLKVTLQESMIEVQIGQLLKVLRVVLTILVDDSL